MYSATGFSEKILCISASFPLMGTKIVSPAISRETISFFFINIFPHISFFKFIANSIPMNVIPAKAGIQRYYLSHIYWIPHQVRNDKNKSKNLNNFKNL